MTREEIQSAILSSLETAAALGVSRFTLFLWRTNGYLKPILDTGNGLVYWRGDIERVQNDPFYRDRVNGRGRIRRGPCPRKSPPHERQPRKQRAAPLRSRPHEFQPSKRVPPGSKAGRPCTPNVLLTPP
jgi:hypothetical protein